MTFFPLARDGNDFVVSLGRRIVEHAVGVQGENLVHVVGRSHPERVNPSDFSRIDAIFLFVVDIRADELHRRARCNDPDLVPRDLAGVPVNDPELFHLLICLFRHATHFRVMRARTFSLCSPYGGTIPASR